MLAVLLVVVAGLAYRRWHVPINIGVVSALRWIWVFLLHEKACKVAETFLVEAAVLWFVFPVLDSIYDPTKRGNPVLWQAYIVSAVCFVGAIIVAHAGKDG
jgi:hypothetical protein